MTLGLILLTKNELEGVRALAERIPKELFDEALAVDGGSTDGTPELLREKGFRVEAQKNRGRGDAFRLAWEKTKADALLFFSPDGNEDLKDLPRFKPLLERGADIVIASRMMTVARNEEDDQVLKLRKWANNAFNLIANVLWNRGPFVTDTINGYRAVTRKAWELLKPDSVGFTIEYQMTIRAMKKGLKVVEFPTCESSRIGGESGAKSIPTGLRFLRLLAQELSVGEDF